jgi:hypothetical protein
VGKPPAEFPWQERIAEFLSREDEPTVRTPTSELDPGDD